ncbi:TetR/AcrR family transcriptional regulator [Mycobacteroides abscessus]|nr:TetR/AcrR family transcriptional regulator [Mycobacteroides abscessus]MDM1905923.1 TetR/AcrR family transcriptional regulator [Mycobacteroides abscessus]MDM1910678.1 TetR/AcrR family transcriptional regulator [Mycobacteroides abscessus]MDM1919334.1 TetR/AcrR family transcriptional regulator [Mycobacteroides abscessus]
MAKAVTPRGFARERVLEAALEMFTENGVNGTSLQMIADRLGVNKSAVYYQFHTKDEIVLAIFGPVFEDIDRVVRIANALSSPEAKREAAFSGMVELAVRHRRVTFLYFDAAIEDPIRSRQEYSTTYDNLVALLRGEDSSAANRVAVSFLLCGIFGTASDPEVSDVTDGELHNVTMDCGRRLLAAPTESP